MRRQHWMSAFRYALTVQVVRWDGSAEVTVMQRLAWLSGSCASEGAHAEVGCQAARPGRVNRNCVANSKANRTSPVIKMKAWV